MGFNRSTDLPSFPLLILHHGAEFRAAIRSWIFFHAQLRSANHGLQDAVHITLIFVFALNQQKLESFRIREVAKPESSKDRELRGETPTTEKANLQPALAYLVESPLNFHLRETRHRWFSKQS